MFHFTGYFCVSFSSHARDQQIAILCWNSKKLFQCYHDGASYDLYLYQRRQRCHDHTVDVENNPIAVR